MINILITADNHILKVYNNGMLLIEEENIDLLYELVKDTLKSSKGYQKEVLKKIMEKLILEEVA